MTDGVGTPYPGPNDPGTDDQGTGPGTPEFGTPVPLRAALPHELPIPAHVDLRIRNLITGSAPAQDRREVSESEGGGDPGLPEVPGAQTASVIPLAGAARAGARRRRGTKYWLGAAVAAGVIAVASITVVRGGVGTLDDSTAASAPEAAGSAAAAAQPGMADGSAAAAAQPGMADGSALTSLTPVVQVSSGTKYTAGAIGVQIRAVLAHPGDYQPAPELDPGCLSQLTAGSDGTPVLVDHAEFSGEPATVVAVAGPDDLLEIWVVAPTCSSTDPGVRHFAVSQPPGRNETGG